MMRIVGVYGTIGGLLVMAGMLIGMLALPNGGPLGMVVGYLSMLVAMTMVFVGVKRYRDVERGGAIRFLPAFGVGLAIACIAALFYVIGWEIYLFQTDYRFMDVYVADALKAMRAEGKPAAEIARFAAEMEAFKRSYADPVYRMFTTFTEIAPVGLVVAIVSAAVLRNSRILPART